MILASRRTALAAALVTAAFGAGSAKAQADNIVTRRNIEYANHDGVALLGDLYSPKTPGPHPAIIAVHGGGWQAGSKDGYVYWGEWLARRGYVVFAIDYRLLKPGDKKMYPQSVHDVRAAIQFVRGQAASLDVDPNRIALTGDSAGGHLVALVALAGDHPTFTGIAYQDDPNASISTKVKAVAAAYGVYDMVQQWNHDQINRPRDQIAEKYLGAAPMDDRKLYFDASPMSYVTRDNRGISFLITHGTEDDIVDRSQSDNFLIALKQNQNYARHVVMQGSGHFWYTDPIEEPGSVSGFFAPRLLRFLEERL